jgi:hypothetical protein
MRADVKTLKVKMRGPHGSAKTEFLIALARLARGLGMTPALEGDGHNMAITSTRAQRIALYESNHGPAEARRPLLPDGNVA